MALYRTVALSFWTDPKVDDDFTPEDKYFYLYLLTNPHTNMLGCYEISLKQMRIETGYSEDTISKLLDRFENVHKVIAYDYTCKELLIANWYRFNWSTSSKCRISLENLLKEVKNVAFKKYLTSKMNGIYGVGITLDFEEPILNEEIQEEPKEEKKDVKHKYGEYQHVLLTEDEYQKLCNDYTNVDELIHELDEYIEMKGYKAKSHYLAIKRWVVNAVQEKKTKGKSRFTHVQEMPSYMNATKTNNEQASAESLEEVRRLMNQMKDSS